MVEINRELLSNTLESSKIIALRKVDFANRYLGRAKSRETLKKLSNLDYKLFLSQEEIKTKKISAAKTLAELNLDVGAIKKALFWKGNG